MEEMKASSALALLFNSKTQNRTLARQVMDEVREGNIDGVKLHCYLKSMEDLIKSMTDSKGEFREEYMNLVLDDAKKYGTSFEAYGCKIRQQEAGVTYSYYTCNDEKLDDMMRELMELEKKIKERQEFLKHIPEGGVADPDNGNILYPPIKLSTTTLIVTLKK